MALSRNTSLIDTVERFSDRWPRRLQRSLVAVSGGPDSVALVHALQQVVHPQQGQLHIAHFNHHLRGEASDADAEYVRQLAGSLGLPFHLGSSTELTPGQSHLEAAARKLRYRWLIDTAMSLSCTAIVTGHTMNDQAETVLHHLIRGTGWRGLRGIAPAKVVPGTQRSLCLARPLLESTGDEVEEYLRRHGFTPRQDASNLDLRFTRNRIRHQLLPQMVAMNPEAIRHLAEWATVARDTYATIQRTVKCAYQPMIVHLDSTQIAVHKFMVQKARDDFLQELLRLLWRRQRWPVDQMNAGRWREAMEVCRGVRTAVELPGRIMVKAKELVIQFIRQ